MSAEKRACSADGHSMVRTTLMLDGSWYQAERCLHCPAWRSGYVPVTHDLTGHPSSVDGKGKKKW